MTAHGYAIATILTRKWFYFALLVFSYGLTVIPRADAQGYKQTNLISNIPGLAESTHPTLLNPWGIAFFPGAPFWVNDNNAGQSALYLGSGAPFQPLPEVIIPSPTSATGGTPTGIVANFFVASGAFPIPNPAGGNFGP